MRAAAEPLLTDTERDLAEATNAGTAILGALSRQRAALASCGWPLAGNTSLPIESSAMR